MIDFDKLRVVDLSKALDPATEARRCAIRRFYVEVNGAGGYHSDIDITSHLGTHLEFPYHFKDEWKEGMQLPIDTFVGRGVLLYLADARPNAPIRREDLDAADGSRVQPGDVVLLDSPFHSEPFVDSPDDRRPDLSEDAANWSVDKGVKAIGWGDGIAIENDVPGCDACHEILLPRDILMIEVLANLDQLGRDPFLIVYAPLPSWDWTPAPCG